MKKIIFFVALLLTCSLTAQAVIVENYSFELPGTGKISNDWGLIPGWSSDTNPGDSGVEQGAPTDGVWNAYVMGGDPSAWQTTAEIIAAGDYDLTFDAFDGWGSSTVGMALYALEGDGVTRTTIASGSFAIGSTHTLSVTIAGGDAAVGKLLGIEFINDASNWAGIDNIRLVPEPATLILLGLGGLCLRRRKA